MGPNEGKTYLQKTLCAARAIMSYSAKNFEDPKLLRKKLLEYFSEHGDIDGKWFKLIRPSDDWYVTASLKEGGRSCEKPPKGVEIAATFDLRPGVESFLDDLRKAIAFLDSTSARNICFDYFYGPLWGVFNIEELPLALRKSVRDRAYDVEVTKLKKMLPACAPTYNDGLAKVFRDWCKTAQGTQTFPDNQNWLVVKPHNVAFFGSILEKEHKSYRADTFLYGSFMAAIYICTYCAKNLKESTSPQMRKAHPDNVFAVLSLPLTSYEQTDPSLILANTVQSAIGLGFVNQLLEIVIEYRQIVDNKMEEAKESETTDESLDRLYEAMPYAFAAKEILVNLLENSGILGEKVRLVKNSYDIVDEIITVIKNAFGSQLCDFLGDVWEGYKSQALFIKQNDGEAAARKFVNWVVEENLFYPRKFKQALLEEDREYC